MKAEKENFEKNVKETIREFNLITEKAKVIVAVSGGPDSVALLCVLNRLKGELDFSLHVAHLNHGFREKTAEEDAVFVKKLADSMNINYTISKWDVKKYIDKKNISPQQGARTMRYRFLGNVAAKEGADFIATGHNKDDQVETFFMRLLRGSSLEGLSGIPIKRKLETNDSARVNPYIVRPLMYISRKKIEAYLKSINQSFKIDPTNEKSLYLRNKLRLQLIPQMEEINPNFKSLVFDTAELLSQDNDYLKVEAEKLFKKSMLESSKGHVKLDYRHLKAEHVALKTRVFKKAARMVSHKDLDKKHIEYIQQGIENNMDGYIDLPGGLKFYLDKDGLNFTTKAPKKPAVKAHFTSVEIPGKTYWSPLGAYIVADVKDINFISKDQLLNRSHEAFLDYVELKGKNIIARTRKEGDDFLPLGMKSHKKLKDFLIDAKVPAEIRDDIPIVTAGDYDMKEILWVAPYRINDNYKVTTNTKMVLHLRLQDEEGRSIKYGQDRKVRRIDQ